MLQASAYSSGAKAASPAKCSPRTTSVTFAVFGSLANQREPIPFIVDTGAPWCVLNPLEFEKIADQAEPIEEVTDRPLNIRGNSYTGCLCRLSIWLPALLGESLEVDATVFVPDEEWFYPNFIGLDGFLNRIRFAVDPKNNLFFFGALDD